MTKRGRIKGIHDIATVVHKPRRKDNIKIDVGRTGLGDISSKNGSIKKVNMVSPRTWVFSTRPRFIRYQKPIEKSLLVDKVEEPTVNILEEVKEVVVLAEMPGANEESISCKVKDDILSIFAEAKDSWGTKKYEREILLPFIVDSNDLESSYEDQILEIKLARKEKGVHKKRKSPNSGSKDKKGVK
ncbi:MAG: Hsp20/alpha crystallin family protein [candidate division Zixibacteria bacterium]|nr:Hsp20/alpha crystallin family protein [candidate division Zixibacteria bacterium]